MVLLLLLCVCVDFGGKALECRICSTRKNTKQKKAAELQLGIKAKES